MFTKVIIGALIISVTVSMFLGVEGVEIDFTHSKVRKYRKTLWFRSGKWKNLDTYNKIALNVDTFSYSTSSPTGSRRNRHKTFDIKLVGESDVKPILLKECSTYTDAKRKLISFSEEIGIEPQDYFEESLEKSNTSPRR